MPAWRAEPLHRALVDLLARPSSSDPGQGRCSADLQRPSVFLLSHLVSAPTDVAEDPFLADVACLCNLIVLPGVACLCTLIVLAGGVQL